MTLDELYDYIRIGREKRERHEPLVTLLPQRVGFFTRKNKLQEEMDDLKRILREKTAEIFQLERIHFATGNPHQQMQWGNQQYQQYRALPPADRRQSTIIEDRKLAEKFSEEELTILTQQCQELRSRINELETKIRNRDPSCVINGGKTKSKHTKSKHTKSKHTKSKYTKSKKTKRRNRKYSKRN
jgi:chromosome segregation ATPase